MLFKPVYLKGKAMAQAKIPMRPPRPPQLPEGEVPPPLPPIPPPQGASFDFDDLDADEDEDGPLPVLICKKDCRIVYPHEATRKVLTGKVAYYFADDTGVTRFSPKHVFCALKLNRKERDKYGEYPIVGAHQRFLEKKERKSLGYRRRYISQDVSTRGIFGRYAGSSREPLPMTPFTRGLYGPRA